MPTTKQVQKYLREIERAMKKHEARWDRLDDRENDADMLELTDTEELSIAVEKSWLEGKMNTLVYVHARLKGWLRKRRKK